MPLRHTLALASALLGLAIRSGAEAAPERPRPSPCPEVMARVDGRPITLHAVGLIAALKLRVAPDSRREDVYYDAMNARIRRELLVGEAVRQGLTAEPVRVQEAEKEVREGFTDDAAWRAFLAAHGIDAAVLRTEADAEGLADTLMACELDNVPMPDDAETIRLFHIYVQPNSLEPLSPGNMERWRYEFRRKKRSMAGRELFMRLMQQAKIDRYFEPGTCAP